MGIYVMMGGSYSPPTIAHITALQKAVNHVSTKHPGQAVTGIFVPVSQEYKKNSVKIVSEADRLEMLQRAVNWLNENNTNPNVSYKVSAHEMNAKRAVPTIESLEMLISTDPSGIFYLAVGEDNLKDIIAGKWYRSADLIRQAHILYFSRPDGDAGSAAGPNLSAFEKVEFDASSVSSTRLRAALAAKNASVSELTISPILDYIREKRLYGVTGGKRRQTRRKSRRRRVRN
jgi:nicotinate (nicotinamide) nucleotide adenylyltransferase